MLGVLEQPAKPRGMSRRAVESKTTKTSKEKACDTHEEGNGGGEQELAPKYVGKDKNKNIKGRPSGKGRASFLPAGAREGAASSKLSSWPEIPKSPGPPWWQQDRDVALKAT